MYRVIEQKGGYVRVRLARNEHPVFRAHFPGDPILPGFVQIEIIAQILGEVVVAIEYSKFISPVFPEETITYIVEHKEAKTKVKIMKDAKKVSEFVYVHK